MSIGMMGRTGTVAAGEARALDRGREQVLSDLFDAHYARLRSLAQAMLGDAAAAEEVVSEVFVKAFGGWRRFRRVEHHPSYLRAMVVNGCRTRIRRRRIEERANAIAHRRESGRNPSADLDRRLSDLDLAASVRILPERQRACVVLRYMEDLSERQIAEILGCSPGTVKSQLFKARARLERQLSPGGAAS